MFLVRRPSLETIDRFLRESQDLPLSYGPIGLVKAVMVRHDLDEATVAIGHGKADFERARAALIAWKQFDIGWVETFPPHAPVAVGTVVAVLIRHLGFWSLNGCRVLYCVGDEADNARFGFAYGTLTNHAETGEELFEVFIDPQTADVFYRIRATSSPQATLAWVGQPIVRVLQARFRRHSVAAMKRATGANGRTLGSHADAGIAREVGSSFLADRLPNRVRCSTPHVAAPLTSPLSLTMGADATTRLAPAAEPKD